MLTRIEIGKFRSCENVVLDNIDRMTALVGRNGAGKTNILQAIRWIARSASEPGSHDSVTTLFEENHVTANLELDGEKYRYDLQVAPEDNNNIVLGAKSPFQERLTLCTPLGDQLPIIDRAGEVVRLGGADEIRIGESAAAIPTLLSILPAESNWLAQIRPVHDFFQRVRYYPLDEAAGSSERSFIDERDYKKWLANYRPRGDSEESVQLRLLHMYLEDRAHFDEVASLLGRDGLGLIDSINVLSEKAGPPNERGEQVTFFWIYFVLGAKMPRSFSWGQLSLGTRRILRMLVSLVFDRSAVMLLEHPEDAIHRGLLRKLIGLLQSYSDPVQVIIASHSSVVVNCLQPRETRLVNMDRGKTDARALNQQELALASKFLEEEGTLEDFIETLQQEE
jgi:predicted ATPase